MLFRTERDFLREGEKSASQLSAARYARCSSLEPTGACGRAKKVSHSTQWGAIVDSLRPLSIPAKKDFLANCTS